jgi:voltage-gated potassium channel
MGRSDQLGIVREMRLAIVALFALLAVGTAGYVLLEGWCVLDAYWMTVITVFTVGFSEVHELSSAGRIFTSLLIMFGVGIALWAGASVLQHAISPTARMLLRRRRMDRQIAALHDHYIICGYGRIGREVCRVFRRRGVPYAVGDTDEATIAELLESGGPAVQGDCTDDATLRALGIDRAKGLVAAAGSDADNTFIVLSARALRPDLYIVARATAAEVESKLLTAGADRAVTPYQIGGQRIATAAVQPTIVDFLDVAMHGNEVSLALDEVHIREGSPLSGTTLADSGIRQQSGAVVVAVKPPDGPLNSNPAPDTLLVVGDVLIALGTVQQLKDLDALAG